jgi:hypothetical protein
MSMEMYPWARCHDAVFVVLRVHFVRVYLKPGETKQPAVVRVDVSQIKLAVPSFHFPRRSLIHSTEQLRHIGKRDP